MLNNDFVKTQSVSQATKEKFLSYAQEYEDLIIYHVLKDVEHGFYIDVGANDPWELSVTKSMYERGWNGINIEPLQDKYNQLVIDRKRDINCCMGAGSEDGKILLYEQGTGSTCDERFKRNPDTINGIYIPIKRLTDIIKTYIPNSNPDIHFCKIDVEGFEKSVLEGMDFSVARPWMFVMEATIPRTAIPCHEEWEYILINAGYDFVFQHGINRYYLDNQKAELKNRFIGVEGLNSIYEVYKCKKDKRDYSNENFYYKVGKFVTFPFRPLRPLIKKLINRK